MKQVKLSTSVTEIEAQFPGCLVMEEDAFASRAERNRPVTVLRKFWSGGARMIAFRYTT